MSLPETTNKPGSGLYLTGSLVNNGHSQTTRGNYEVIAAVALFSSAVSELAGYCLVKLNWFKWPSHEE